jgi:hypothetical protein
MSAADFTLSALLVLGLLSTVSAWLVRRAELRRQNEGRVGKS